MKTLSNAIARAQLTAGVAWGSATAAEATPAKAKTVATVANFILRCGKSVGLEGKME